MKADITFEFNVTVSQLTDIPKELFEEIKSRQHEEIDWNNDCDLYHKLENLVDFTQAVELGVIEVTGIKEFKSEIE